MNNFEIERVAKGGGTSLADPTRFADQLAYRGNEAEVVVVSAAGRSHELGLSTKLTDRLFDLHHNDEQDSCNWAVQQITGHVAVVGSLMDPTGHNEVIQGVIDRVESDIDEWRRLGQPVMALGEKWTAEMFAAYTGREFIDAASLIRFDPGGRLDVAQTRINIQQELSRDGSFVVPGFYGSSQYGNIHLLPRGGSDVTAALVADALHADSYHNWSDVSGFFTADPRLVPSAQHIRQITRREVREMGLGCELLHPDAIRYSGENTPIHLRNTFGEPNEEGTVILPSRRWSEMPFVGIVARGGLVELALYEYGMNDSVGSTTAAFNMLASNGIPYEHAATSADNLSVVFGQEHAAKISPDFNHYTETISSMDLRPLTALRVVGEGLVGATRARRAVKRRIEVAFDEHDIAEIGVTDAPHTASITYMIEPQQEIGPMLNAIHEAVFSC